MIRGSVGRVAALAVAVATLTSACSTGDRDSAPVRPFPQARRQVTAFVEQTLAYTAPGREAVPGALDGDRADCKDRYGLGDSRGSWAYDRELRNVDRRLADAIVARAAARWRSQGLEVIVDNDVPGVSVLHGSAPEEDFDYKLTVNRIQRAAYLTGRTPCYRYEDLPPRPAPSADTR